MNDELVEFLTKTFQGTTADEILEIVYTQTPKGQVPMGLKIGGELQPSLKVAKLRHEAEQIIGFEMWHLLKKRLEYIAQVKAIKAQDEDAIIFPKALVFAIQEIDKVLRQLVTLKVETKK